MPSLPNFAQELLYWQQNIVVAGVDEAGMGALAGPVVAAAVIFAPHVQTRLDQLIATSIKRPIIRDSKTLSAKQRDVAAAWIKINAETWAVGTANIQEITKLNIRNASHLAMQRAIDQLHKKPDVLLLDGTPAQPHPMIPANNIIDGDNISFSIAAASILAKTHRDATMIALDKKFPVYGFAAHKGYGATTHLTALRKHGVSPHHRPTYTPIAQILANAQT